MIRQRASAPGNKERRSRQQQQQNLLPQYHQYQHQQQEEPIIPEPPNNTLSWEREEETTTWSLTTNDSGDDLVDEELGGEPDLPIAQAVPQPVNLPANSAPYPTAVVAAIPTHPSFYRTLYFQIPDSKYREHHQHRLHNHHRKVRLASSSSSPSSPPTNIYSRNGKSSKYRFLYVFSSPHECARALGWYSIVAMIFLLFVGLLIDSQPLYIRGVLPRATLDHPRALRKFKVLIPTGATRLAPAKHAFQAALAYFLTMCLSWAYGYHWIQRAWARIRRRHYKDIPDHYYPDDIQSNNNHHHHSKDGSVMGSVANIIAPICSRISAKSQRFCQSICAGGSTRHSNQTLPWQGKCLAFVFWCQILLGALGDVCLMGIRRVATSMRYTSTKRTRGRRSTSTTAAVSGSSLTIPSGDAATTTTVNTTATQRKRRKNTSTTNRNESQSPPVTGAGEATPPFASSGKHKHG